MSYIQRLQTGIELTSPEGSTFRAKWIGGERNREKKLGLFTYPDVNGTIAQDLNVNSTKYPISIIFDGADNDLISEKFFKATEEIGTWQVIHPVKGFLELQLISVSEGMKPVEEGNMTIFDLQFMEPADATIIQSVLQLRGGIRGAIRGSNDSALQQFADQVTNVTGKARTAVNNATNKVKNAIDSVLGPIAQINDSLNSAFNQILRDIDTTIEAAILAPAQLAGEFQELVQLPARVAASTAEKFQSYGTLINEVYGLDGDTKETFAVKDLILSACIGAIAELSASTDAQTRSEILDQVELVGGYFNGITNQLDNDMDNVITDKIENQYISQETTYPDNLFVSSLATDYLLKSAVNLSVEKTFILKDYELPIMITIREYGQDGDALDYFYKTNNIDNEEFILLPPGKQITVYPGVVF
jgi:hypothetical protein